MDVTYKFDGDLGVIEQIVAFEDDTKRTLADFLPNTVVDTYDI